MREILFRGKRKLNKEWIAGSLHTEKFTADEEYLCCEINQCDVYPETVGQYTGLTDKNGKRIFEGDIVLDEQSEYNYLIKWFPEYACFSLANKNGHMEFGCDEIEIFLNDLVVIGNVTDNPELLKGE